MVGHIYTWSKEIHGKIILETELAIRQVNKQVLELKVPVKKVGEKNPQAWQFRHVRGNNRTATAEHSNLTAMLEFSVAPLSVSISNMEQDLKQQLNGLKHELLAQQETVNLQQKSVLEQLQKLHTQTKEPCKANITMTTAVATNDCPWFLLVHWKVTLEA